jgi:DNA replication protein DnaC
MIPPMKIEIAKNSIKEKCSECKDLKRTCYNCVTKQHFIDRMASANIPVDYWNRTMKDFYGCDRLKETADEYLKDINQLYTEGTTVYFAGERGRGKTMVSCSLLKKAILSGYSSYYTTLTNLVDDILRNNNQRTTLQQIDFLVIDEIDNRFFPTINSMELYGGQLESIIRSRMQNKLPTIMCSNAVDIGMVFGGQYGTSFKSLWSQFVNVVVVGGPDARKNKEKLNG